MYFYLTFGCLLGGSTAAQGVRSALPSSLSSCAGRLARGAPCETEAAAHGFGNDIGMAPALEWREFSRIAGV